MSYEAARHFADTWGLVLLVVLFVGLILWIFRRGSTQRYREAARIPLEADEQPAPENPAPGDRAMNEIKREVRDDPPAQKDTQ